ncbi:MAG: hypothetical protein R6U50_02105 [Desulfobacterales bacterium]
MKQYVIDELRPGEYDKIKSYLDEAFGKSAVDDVYWVPLDKEFLTEEQLLHNECGPHCFAVVLEENLVACEFLIRTKNRIRCNCMGYADEKQQTAIIRFADNLFRKLNIPI